MILLHVKYQDSTGENILFRVFERFRRVPVRSEYFRYFPEITDRGSPVFQIRYHLPTNMILFHVKYHFELIRKLPEAPDTFRILLIYSGNNRSRKSGLAEKIFSVEKYVIGTSRASIFHFKSKD